MSDNYIDDLTKALAECRDALPVPPRGSKLEVQWGAAMGDPLEVPEYVRQFIAASAPNTSDKQEAVAFDVWAMKEYGKQAVRASFSYDAMRTAYAAGAAPIAQSAEQDVIAKVLFALTERQKGNVIRSEHEYVDEARAVLKGASK